MKHLINTTCLSEIHLFEFLSAAESQKNKFTFFVCWVECYSLLKENFLLSEFHSSFTKKRVGPWFLVELV